MADDHSLDTQLLARFLKKRFHDEKPMDVVSVEVKNAVPKGENFASTVYRVKLNCLTAAGKRRTFSVVVKTELQGEGFNEVIDSLSEFRVETKIYTTILPMMGELMEEFGDRREQLWPRLLGCRPYNMIAFEDLTDKGYVGVERRNSLDFNHSKLVLRNLARFHSMSKVLLARGIITADDKGVLGYANDSPGIGKWWDCQLTVLSDGMVSHWGDEWKELAKKLTNQKGLIVPKLKALENEYDKSFEVFNHGDLWTCNMLFKYMEYEDNLPVSVKFVDYQVCHISSFIWDVAHFLITSTIPSVRRSRLDELFEAYQLSLEEHLTMFNYAGCIPSLDNVKSEWERVQYAQFCFFILHCSVAAETPNAFDMEKLATHQPHEIVNESIFVDGKALNAIGEDLRNLSLTGII